MWPTFDSQDDIPEQFRDSYEERDGKWVAKQSGTAGDAGGGDSGPTAADLDALKTVVQKERDRAADADKRAKALEAKLKALEASQSAGAAGIDTEEAKAWRESQYQEIRAEIQEELDALKSEKDDVATRLREEQLDNRVKALALKHGVKGDNISDWWTLNHEHFDLDDSGEPIVRDGKGKAVASFIADDLKKQRPWLYEGTKADGGGAGGSHGGGAASTHGMSFEEFQKLSPAEKMKAARHAETAA